MNKCFAAMLTGLVVLVMLLAGCTGPTSSPSPGSAPAPISSPSPSPAPTPKPQVEVTLRLTHQYAADNNAVGDSVNKFAKLVGERSAGKMEIKVFPAQQLYKVGDYLKLMQAGTLDMAVLPAVYFSGEVPIGAFTTLPGNYLNIDHAMKSALSKPGTIMQEAYSKAGIKWLAGFFTYVGWSGTVEILGPENFKGRAVRVVGSYNQRWVESMGGKVSTVSSAEIYTALQRKTFDIAEISWSSGMGYKFYEVAKYANTSSSYVGSNPLWISNTAWNRLTKAQQDVLVDSARLADLFCSEASKAEATDVPKFFAQQGVNVHYATDAERVAWQKSQEYAVNLFIQELGPVANQLIAAVKAER